MDDRLAEIDSKIAQQPDEAGLVLWIIGRHDEFPVAASGTLSPRVSSLAPAARRNGHDPSPA